MKKRIVTSDGKRIRCDTDAAVEIFQWENEISNPGHARFLRQTVYCTKSGHLFLYAWGGSQSRAGNANQTPGERIDLISDEDFELAVKEHCLKENRHVVLEQVQSIRKKAAETHSMRIETDSKTYCKFKSFQRKGETNSELFKRLVDSLPPNSETD